MSNFPPNYMQSMASMGGYPQQMSQPQMQPSSFRCPPNMMPAGQYQCMQVPPPMWNSMQSSQGQAMQSPSYYNQPQNSPLCMAPQPTASFVQPETLPMPDITIPPMTPYMIVNGQPQPMVGPPPQLLWTDPIN